MGHILITGGCGFVGSNLAVDLAYRGFQVTVLDNLSRDGSAVILEKRILPHGIQFVRGDVRDSADLKMLKDDYQLLIECCAEPSVLAATVKEKVRYVLDVNLMGAINCFEWAVERSVPVIFISSSRVYPYDRLNSCEYREADSRFEYLAGCPGVSPKGVSVEMPLSGIRSMYGASKLCAEHLLREYAVQSGLPAIIDRCGVVAGPWQMGRIDQGVFTYWLARHYFRKPLDYIGYGGLGKQVRDLLHVQDLADLVAIQANQLLSQGKKYTGEIFNAGGSLLSNLSLRETTGICQMITGNKLDIGSVPTMRPADLMWYITDNGLTESAFGWRPKRSAMAILEECFYWLRENEEDLRNIF